MSNMIPFEYLFYVAGPLVAVILYMGYRSAPYKEFGDIARTFAKAEKGDGDIIELYYPASNTVEFLLGKSDNHDDPFYEVEGFPVKLLKPDQTHGKCVPAYYKGVAIYPYCNHHINSLSNDSAISYNTLVRHRNDAAVKDINKRISHISDRDLFSLFKSSVEDLKKDCELFVDEMKLQAASLLARADLDVINSKFPDEAKITDEDWMKQEREERVQEIYDAVMKMKVYLFNLPGETGFYSKVLAFDVLPFNQAVHDVERIIVLLKEQFARRLDLFGKIWMMAIAGAVVIGAIGISFFIINKGL